MWRQKSPGWTKNICLNLFNNSTQTYTVYYFKIYLFIILKDIIQQYDLIRGCQETIYQYIYFFAYQYDKKYIYICYVYMHVVFMHRV